MTKEKSGFDLVESFKLGYRNREDVTNLPIGVMVVGSQNVITNTANRLGVVKGYTLDGASSAVIAPITASYDFLMNIGYERHLRAYLDPTTNCAVLQYRYVDSSGNVTWRDLIPASAGLLSANFNFTDFWDFNTEKKSLMLFVNGTTDIYEWSGAITTFASCSNATGFIQTLTSAPTAGGNGYMPGDILTINGGTATCKVLTVNSGVVTAISLLTNSGGYSIATGIVTTGGHGNGCTVAVSAVLNNAITKEGTKSWAEEGFYNLNADRTIVLNGVEYTYQGGETTTTLLGLNVDPTLVTNNVGDPIHQKWDYTTQGGLTALGTPKNDLIANLRNQIYIGDLTNRSVYVSKQNNYKDYSFTSPVRAVGEGALLTLDAPPVAFIPQETQMYISAGKSHWYNTKFTLSTDLTKEDFSIEKLKTAQNQGAISQAAVTKDKNDVVFLTFEPVLSTIGRVAGNLATPQAGDKSFSIINDMNSYDLTDACCYYWKNFLIFSVPSAGLIRVYNQTDPKAEYWEAPITYPIARFSEIDGNLYGHSYNSPETYKLFDGYNFNGASIPSLAVFSYMNFGSRASSKGINEWFQEGYISQNGILTTGLRKDMDGNAVDVSYDLDGDMDGVIVAKGGTSSPIGKDVLGSNPLGGDLADNPQLPPRFRNIYTMAPDNYFYELQPSFYSNMVDFRWELLAFGTKIIQATDLNVNIKI